MTDYLSSNDGNSIYQELKPEFLKVLGSLNKKNFESTIKYIDDLKESFKDLKLVIKCQEESYLNDLYILNSQINFIEAYCSTWRLVLMGSFTESWSRLQDSIDHLRTIKKFSKIPLNFFENQLIELEKAYPYDIFFSVGMVVEKYECSICGEDIDSFECPHTLGELYSGEMAIGKACNVKKLDHIAIVTSPMDKRCTIQHENQSDVFNIIRHLANDINNNKFKISWFKGIELLSWEEENPDFLSLGRNEPCFCGSGIKFKKCCINKKMIEKAHAEILLEQADFSGVILS